MPSRHEAAEPAPAASSRPREAGLPYLLIIGGAIAGVASFIIMLEKLQLLVNPAYHPSCSINPIISCGSVMQSWQSHVFGFPNPLLGLAAFPAVITVGVAMKAGATYARWFWRCLEAGSFLGVCFVLWLFSQSVYRIHALCPYCMVVWAMTIMIFWYVTLYNLRRGHIRLPGRSSGVANFLQRHHADVLVGWYAIIVLAILQHFWYYWKTLFL